MAYNFVHDHTHDRVDTRYAWLSRTRWPLVMMLSLIMSIGMISATSQAQTLTLPPALPAFVRSGAGASQFIRYTPFPCAMVPFRIESMALGTRLITWSDRWPPTNETRRDDTNADAVTRDSAAAAVRRCVGPQTITNTPFTRWWGMGAAWLSINAFAQADTAFTAILQHTAKAPLVERGALLRDLVIAYAADTHAVRRTTAAAYMQQLDALGTQASAFRIAAHNALFDLGQLTDNMPLMMEQAELALRIGNAMPNEMRKAAPFPYALAIVHQADLDGRRGDFVAAVESLTKAYQELKDLDPRLAEHTIGRQLDKSKQYGKVMEPIKTNFVYLPGDSTAVPSAPLPRDGRVSLIVSINHHDFRREQLARYATVFQLLEQFGDNMDIVLLGETSGYHERRLVPAAEEAPLVRDFYRTYLKLPATIALWTRTVTNTRPDGMRIYMQNPNPVGDVILVDKERRVRNIDSGPPARLAHMIEELLR
jgi:hypothetical protein